MVPVGFGRMINEVRVMKGMYGFLSRSFGCLAVALVILSVLAMPTQNVMANDPSSDGGNAVGVSCWGVPDPDCTWNDCYYDNGDFYKPCTWDCGCP